MNNKLSKSQYVQGLQCAKRLWLYRNRKDLTPPVDPATQARFDAGNEIGLFAQRYFNDGVEVTNEYWDVAGAVAATETLISNHHNTIYEATAVHPIDGSYARIDILRKIPDSDEWKLIEVKSATSVKDYHLHDMSFQYHVFHGAGYKIRRCFIMLIDNGYVRDGEVDPRSLFRLEDISEQVFALQDNVQHMATQLNHVLDQKKEPSADIGARCFDPFECPFRQYCWQNQANVPDYSIYNIYPKAKADDMAEYFGSCDIQAITPDMMPNGVKAIDVQCVQDNIYEHVETNILAAFLARLEYPLYFLDYETIMSAIPLFDGTRPYQQIVFQFSCHVQDRLGADVRHYEFLHKSPSDPREEFVKSLIDVCGDTGSVIVYNQPFEAGRNRELGETLPSFAAALEAINDRMVDLMIPFKNRTVYKPEQQSSYSIKKVLPAWVEDLSYDDMAIAGGGAAMNAYAQFMNGHIDSDRLPQLWNDLSAYCELDTYAMVRLLDVLKEKVRL